MPMRLFSQIKKEPESVKWGSDILSGVVVALVSIPILVFGLLTTSRQFVVGVDAMPAAMVGGFLAEMGIAAESDDALHLVPAIAICVALWFGVFFLFKAGRIVKYISAPVMGGFISGVGMTIILMQLPKLFGGNPGTGEIIDLAGHIYKELSDFHPLSFELSLCTIIIILLCKRKIPKVPMTVIMLVIGALLEYFIGLDKYGVKIMAPVEAGLPKPVWPDPFAGGVSIQDLVVDSFGIAGGAVFLIGMLQLVSYWGAFDTFGYSFSSFRHKSRYEDLYEYTVKKQESRRVNELTFMPFIVVGLVFLLICLILRLMM